MARHYRFFLRNPESFPLLGGESFQLLGNTEPEIVFQMGKVLRIKPGDMVTLVPQEHEEQRPPFQEYLFEVTGVTKNSVELVKKKVIENENELQFALELWLCLPNKPEKLEFIVQKAVEIGVTAIHLFESDFSQMKHQLRLDRLQKILIEASEQSERAMVPVMKMEGSLGKFLKSVDDAMLKNVFAAMERFNSSSGDSDSGNPFASVQKDQGISVLVGPEGGFSDAEKDVITGRSLQKFSLGKRVLRMETAAIISLGLAALE